MPEPDCHRRLSPRENAPDGLVARRCDPAADGG